MLLQVDQVATDQTKNQTRKPKLEPEPKPKSKPKPKLLKQTSLLALLNAIMLTRVP